MNMRKLLKQAEEMQSRVQREMGDTVAEAAVGGGMVTVKMNGHKHLLSVEIEKDAVDPDDVGMLEDLIVAAVNEASRKIDELLRHRVGSLAASLPNLL